MASATLGGLLSGSTKTRRALLGAIGLAFLAAALALVGVSGAASGSSPGGFRFTLPKTLRASAASAASGAFTCPAPGSFHLELWLYQRSTGIVAHGHFPAPIQAAPGSAAAKAAFAKTSCTGAARRWTVRIDALKGQSGHLKPGTSTVCWTAYSHSRKGFANFQASCRSLHLR
jgi:hypothetical protein